ncbi:MAG TPA: hypothetical protein VH280_18690 [Verrucomicrobiae bacterium]|jgi:hypothetical protein|nr:hypothetical protein [Verrucomicrobiae bacterium]
MNTTTEQEINDRTAYAGIDRATCESSIDVKTNAARLRRFQYVLRRLLLTGAGHLPARKEWELKLAIARHLFEDAEQATALLNRITELRVTENQAQTAPDAVLALFMDEAIHCKSDAEYLLGVYEIVRPELLAAIQAHLHETQQLVDYPTVRILKFLCMEMEEQIALGKALIARFVTDAQRAEAAEYVRNLRDTLEKIGGIAGESPAKKIEARRWRSTTPYTLPPKSARPDDFGPSLHYRLPGCLDETLSDAENAFREMMKMRQEEMTAAEMVAAVMFETTEMPWGFYRTLARHTWDEARHAAFGQAALENHGIQWRATPHYTAEYEMFRGQPPAKAYAFLALGVETSAMAKSGKQHEWQLCRDVFKDRLMTLFQDYDWADEIQHARFGKEWGTAFFDDDFERTRAYGEEAWKELLRYRASQEPDREKYHTAFYMEKFGKMPMMKVTDAVLAADGE